MEQRRYESNALFRFEGSDFFGLGPFVAYLRDVPHGARPRTVFLGNSVIFGYKLETSETLPAAYQALNPQVKVFNLAINNLETGSSYLIAKSIIDSVDTLFVLLSGTNATPTLAQFIPVDAADREHFGLLPPNRTELELQHALDFWRLYRDAYRLQNAMFGSSTRMYLYQHKASMARAAVRSLTSVGREFEPSAGDAPPGVEQGSVDMQVPMSTRPPSIQRLRELSGQYPLLFKFATLAVGHNRRIVFLDFIGYWTPLPDADSADLNAHFAPHATVLQLKIPTDLRLDTQHLTARGARIVARSLVEQPLHGGQVP